MTRPFLHVERVWANAHREAAALARRGEKDAKAAGNRSAASFWRDCRRTSLLRARAIRNGGPLL